MRNQSLLFSVFRTTCLLIVGCILSLSVSRANEKTVFISETNLGAGVSETLAKEGDFVYVAKHSNGVDVIDVSDPEHPVKLTTIDPDGPTNNTVDVWDVQVLNNVLFVFNKGSAIDPNPGKGNWTGVYIYDVSNPLVPTEVGAITWGLGGGYHLGAWTESGEVGLIAGVPHIFVCSAISSDVEIFDVSDPSIPVWKSTVLRPQWRSSEQTVYQNGKLYTAWGTEGFTIDDVSDPSNPVRLGRQAYTGPTTVNGGLRTLCPTPDGLHLITGEYTTQGDVRLWSIANPSAISQVASWRLNANSLLWTVHATNDYAYIAHLESGIRVLDIRTRTGLTPVGFYDPETSTPVRTWDGISDIVIVGMTLYACHETRGLFVVEHDPNLPPPEVVTITSATYRRGNKQLKVYATSTRQPTPTLTLTGFGTMTWNGTANRYEFVRRVNSNPGTVNVTSTAGGSASKTVTVTN